MSGHLSASQMFDTFFKDPQSPISLQSSRCLWCWNCVSLCLDFFLDTFCLLHLSSLNVCRIFAELMSLWKCLCICSFFFSTVQSPRVLCQYSKRRHGNVKVNQTDSIGMGHFQDSLSETEEMNQRVDVSRALVQWSPTFFAPRTG